MFWPKCLVLSTPTSSDCRYPSARDLRLKVEPPYAFISMIFWKLSNQTSRSTSDFAKKKYVRDSVLTMNLERNSSVFDGYLCSPLNTSSSRRVTSKTSLKRIGFCSSTSISRHNRLVTIRFLKLMAMNVCRYFPLNVLSFVFDSFQSFPSHMYISLRSVADTKHLTPSLM